MSEMSNPMLAPRIVKVTVNIGVGEGGNRLSNAEKVLELLAGVKPIRTLGKQQNRDLKVRVGAPIGCKATIRNPESIKKFLTDAFGSERTLFQLGILMLKETSPLEFVIILTSPTKNTTPTSEFLVWIST